MAELKTQPHDGDVDAFLDAIEDDTRRADARVLRDLMAAATGAPARMWGESIVGFGDTHYRYASGREGDWFEVGFSPRKRSLSIYLMTGFEPHAELLDRLGKHKAGVACLYVNRLTDVDVEVLRALIEASVAYGRPDRTG